MEQARLHEFERRCIQEEPAECVAACPLHVDARSFVVAVARGAWDEAWKVLRRTMPLPAVLGHICDHPCESRCKRRDCGEAIRIGALERACMGTPVSEQRVLPLPRRDRRIAVAGSGLAGLTVAWDLARKGYPVTVFDPGERPGGPLLRFPEKVLPAAALESELTVMKKLGVEFRCGELPGVPALRTEFDAVFVGLDAGLPEFDGLPGEAEGVFAGGETPAGAEVSPVGWALAGRKAAVSIDRMLQGVSLTAGREKEGPQVTRLFVNLAGAEPLPAVRPANEGDGYTEAEAQQEADRCLRCECLECVKVCEYLKHFGSYPRRYARDVYNNASIVLGERKANLFVNSCMLCDLCTVVCPEDFSMPDLCLSARREMVARGKMPPSAHEFALEDYRWSHGESFALAHPAPGDARTTYVLFPGCQLSGSNPGQVEAAYRHLRDRLSGGVGLMLDCCGAPARWAGREDLHQEGLADLTARWEALSSPVLVFACPTCQLMIAEGIPQATCMSLWQALEMAGLPEGGEEGRESLPVRAVHDPCTAREATDIQASVRGLLSALGQPLEELTLSAGLTECCGYGGLQLLANSQLAAAVATRRAGESPLEYVTYCAMCRDSLAAAGKRVLHLLDLVFPTASDAAGRPRPGWSERRENRAWLRMRMLHELSGDDAAQGGMTVESSPRMELHISPEVQERLDVRRILREDVEAVIDHAEQTGEKFCLPDTGRFVASFRPRAVAFWVEYAPHGTGFVVHNAYSHRMVAERGLR